MDCLQITPFDSIFTHSCVIVNGMLILYAFCRHLTYNESVTFSLNFSQILFHINPFFVADHLLNNALKCACHSSLSSKEMNHNHRLRGFPRVLISSIADVPRYADYVVHLYSLLSDMKTILIARYARS